jgi:hypothetical protein
LDITRENPAKLSRDRNEAVLFELTMPADSLFRDGAPDRGKRRMTNPATAKLWTPMTSALCSGLLVV